MVFHQSLSDNKSPQVSRNLLCILVVLNNVVVWTVSTRPPTSKSSSPFNSPLVTLQSAPITIGIIIIIIIILIIFHASVSWWSFTRVWVTASNHKFCPQISNSSSSFTKNLGTFPRTPITIDITVTFMFHSFLFFSWLLSSLFYSFESPSQQCKLLIFHWSLSHSKCP